MRETLLARLIHKHSPSFKRRGTGRNTGRVAMPGRIRDLPDAAALWAISTNIPHRHSATTVLRAFGTIRETPLESGLWSPTPALSSLAADAESAI